MTVYAVGSSKSSCMADLYTGTHTDKHWEKLAERKIIMYSINTLVL